MLKPAQLYKDEIKKELTARWYDVRYQHYFAGARDELSIPDNAYWQRHYAFIDQQGVLSGYFCYKFNEIDKSIGNFGFIGFKHNNMEFIKEVTEHILHMFSTGQAQRAEIWAIADNRACSLYRRFAKQYGGKEVAHLHRTTYYDGSFHDTLVWEFLSEDIIQSVGFEHYISKVQSLNQSTD